MYVYRGYRGITCVCMCVCRGDTDLSWILERTEALCVWMVEQGIRLFLRDVKLMVHDK